MRPLSILHVAQPLDAGVPGVAGRLVADQARRGWHVAVACPAGSALREAAAAAGARAVGWEATRSPGPAVPAETWRLRRAIADVAPDLVHLHSAKAGLAGRLALRGTLPTVFQPHAWSFEAAGGATGAAARGWERVAARATDAIVCVSADERERGRATGVRARWAVVPNGIDLAAWAPSTTQDRAQARAALGLGGGPLAVLVGRLAEQKGQDVLLRGWPDVLARVPDAELVLVGDGPDRAALEALGVRAVRFVGVSDDVGGWLAAADVAVVPSRWEAGGSLVAMEAMARARSVVATDVAGMRELVGAGGALVPIEAVGPLAAAVAQRLLDRAAADEEGRTGRDRVVARHDVRRSAAAMAELYETVLERRARSTRS